jgi:hypothetical protein
MVAIVAPFFSLNGAGAKDVQSKTQVGHRALIWRATLAVKLPNGLISLVRFSLSK